MNHRQFRFLCTAVVVLAFVCRFSGPTSADDSPSLTIQKTVPRLLSSCVRVLGISDRASGVVISADGHILTVAHGLRADASIAQILSSTGKLLAADVLVHDATNDVALLKLQSPDRLNDMGIAPVALAKTQIYAPEALAGRISLAIGYPAREGSGQAPVCRVGVVETVTEKHIRSSCVLTAGDSGGPLFDSQGQLIGIHQKIGLGKQTNLHIPLAKCLQALHQTLAGEGLPNEPGAMDVLGARFTSLSPPQAISRRCREQCVTIFGAQSGRQLICGTLLPDAVIVTKLSELAPDENYVAECFDGNRYELQFVGGVRNLDLAFLRLQANEKNVLPISNVPVSGDGQVADAAIVLAGADCLPGIVSRINHDEPDGRPALGCTLFERDGHVTVERIAPNSACSDAQLKPADVIRSLGQTETAGLIDVSTALNQFQPGDRLRFLVIRSGERFTAYGQLRHTANDVLGRAEFLDGRAGILSARRTGFSHVLQHDAAIEADQLGSPLYDASGKLIAVNIARRSREAVLAVPIATVKEAAEGIVPQE